MLTIMFRSDNRMFVAYDSTIEYCFFIHINYTQFFVINIREFPADIIIIIDIIDIIDSVISQYNTF